MSRWVVKTIRAAFWIAAAILLAASFVLVLHISANNMEFSRYNPGWNGTSAFFSDLDRHHSVDIDEPETLAAYPKNATLFIIAPQHHPTARELSAYSAFLRQGNTIFLADDFGTGNEILPELGSRITILPGNLSSLDRRYADPYSVIAYRAVNDKTLPLPENILLNRPAPLDGGSSLMLTSVMSWTDANGDRRLNAAEDMGTFPVMATDSIGPGRLIVLSDSSIFINAMYADAGNENNRELIRTIIASDGPVLIDQMNSRTADAQGFSELLHVIRSTVIIEITLICLLMLGIAWAWKKKTI